uniref:Pept_C1 domain-containing protein n=1 Tax=Gongylonema pulchrum TaxID=637853 RepID=A0A183EML9_9BILA
LMANSWNRDWGEDGSLTLIRVKKSVASSNIAKLLHYS